MSYRFILITIIYIIIIYETTRIRVIVERLCDYCTKSDLPRINKLHLKKYTRDRSLLIDNVCQYTIDVLL